MSLAMKGLLLAVCLAAVAVASAASGKEATLNFEVPGGTWKSIRLKNLPNGAVVGIDLRTDGAVTVSLVDDDEHQRSPDFIQPLFSSRVDTKMSFSVTTPSAGHYYVVLDNRLAAVSRRINLTVRAAPGKSGGPIAGGRSAAAEEVLLKFEAQLNRIFVFEPFPIHVRHCGVPVAFVHDAGIVMCAEYAKKLYKTLGDKYRASDALLFTLFHEVGHVLLKQWQYPFHDNEEVADEFATAVMVMLDQRKRVLAKAEYFAANPSISEILAKAFKDDRHPLSVQRARNIRRWAEDPNLVRKWQSIFVPHMQTALLEQLQQQPTSWTDLDLVEKELASRR